jgi:hypothetical protein
LGFFRRTADRESPLAHVFREGIASGQILAAGSRVDLLLHRVCSDDFRYMAGMMMHGSLVHVFFEVPFGNNLRSFRTRSDAERAWHVVEHNTRLMIELDPATDELPDLGAISGWRAMWEPSTTMRMRDRFVHDVGIAAGWMALEPHDGIDWALLYVEYDRRAICKSVRGTETARRALDTIRQSVEEDGCMPVGLSTMPKTYLPSVMERESRFPVIARYGRSNSAYAWGSSDRQPVTSWWVLAIVAGSKLVLPFSTRKGAGAVFDTLVGVTTAGLGAAIDDIVS